MLPDEAEAGREGILGTLTHSAVGVVPNFRNLVPILVRGHPAGIQMLLAPASPFPNKQPPHTVTLAWSAPRCLLALSEEASSLKGVYSIPLPCQT